MFAGKKKKAVEDTTQKLDMYQSTFALEIAINQSIN